MYAPVGAGEAKARTAAPPLAVRLGRSELPGGEERERARCVLGVGLSTPDARKRRAAGGGLREEHFAVRGEDRWGRSRRVRGEGRRAEAEPSAQDHVEGRSSMVPPRVKWRESYPLQRCPLYAARHGD
jgi:hypothetical protein